MEVIVSILAGAAVAVTAVRPRSWRGALAVSALAGASVAFGAQTLRPAILATAPTVAFLLVALLVAAAAVRAGLPARVAAGLAHASRGRPLALYALVCVVTAAATAAVSLDGAVVFVVPVVLELERCGAARRPLVLGVVAVANAFSLALPEGNPTNLLVLSRLGVGVGVYTARALPAGAAAALVCAGAVAVLERDRLRAAGGAAAAPPQLGLWRSVAAVLRLGLQLSSLLVLLLPLAAFVQFPSAGGITGGLAVAGAAAAASALTSNLPAAAAAATLAGPSAFAALAGLSVGALAVEHGSVATLLAGDLAGTRAYDRRLAPVAAAALGLAVVLLWARGL